MTAVRDVQGEERVLGRVDVVHKLAEQGRVDAGGGCCLFCLLI